MQFFRLRKPGFRWVIEDNALTLTNLTQDKPA
jgi:hypothetical protein